MSDPKTLSPAQGRLRNQCENLSQSAIRFWYGGIREFSWSPFFLSALLILGMSGCGWDEPAVSIENRLGETVLMSQVSYGGCLWTAVLRPGERTEPCEPFSGAHQVHFLRFDAQTWADRQGVPDLKPELESKDPAPPMIPGDPQSVRQPRWYPYQTRQSYVLDELMDSHFASVAPRDSNLAVIFVLADEIEQDFEGPSAFEH